MQRVGSTVIVAKACIAAEIIRSYSPGGAHEQYTITVLNC